MSKCTNEELHRSLWRWLAETGSALKWEWPGWQSNGGNVPQIGVLNQCFACLDCWGICSKCPLDWGLFDPADPDIYCQNSGAAYASWMSADNAEDRKKYATIIAELPWRKGGWS